MADTPRIYVACLAAYNAGKLHGEWIDVYDVDQVHEEIRDMLEKSPIPGAEEWAIHDYEGFEGIKIGENESIENIVALAELFEEFDGEVVAAAYDNLGPSTSDLSDIRDYINESYAGSYNSLEDWAYEFMHETMEIPEHLANYIDYEKYANDARVGGDIWYEEGESGMVHVFWSH